MKTERMIDFYTRLLEALDSRHETSNGVGGVIELNNRFYLIELSEITKDEVDRIQKSLKDSDLESTH